MLQLGTGWTGQQETRESTWKTEKENPPQAYVLTLSFSRSLWLALSLHATKLLEGCIEFSKQRLRYTAVTYLVLLCRIVFVGVLAVWPWQQQLEHEIPSPPLWTNRQQGWKTSLCVEQDRASPSYYSSLCCSVSGFRWFLSIVRTGLPRQKKN